MPLIRHIEPLVVNTPLAPPPPPPPLPLDPLAAFTDPPDLEPPDLLDDLPPFEQESYEIQAVLSVVANELARIEAARQALVQNFFPLTADVLLGMFELLLGLPVNPPATLNARRQLVQTYMQRLKSEGRGLDWVALVTSAVGTTNWNYQEYIPSAGNLIPTPSFEYDAINSVPYGWVASSIFNNPGAGVLARTDFAWTGTKSMRIISNGLGTTEGAEAPLVGPFLAGQPYTFSVYLRGGTGGETVVLLFGTVADHATASVVGLTSSGWTRYSVTWTPTTTQGSANACIQLSLLASATVYADGAMAAPGSAVLPYVDGDTPGYVWFGVNTPGYVGPGRSASYAAPGPYAVAVNIPQASAGFAWPLIRDLTPAHLAITQGYTGGFIVGSSTVGSTL